MWPLRGEKGSLVGLAWLQMAIYAVNFGRPNCTSVKQLFHPPKAENHSRSLPQGDCAVVGDNHPPTRLRTAGILLPHRVALGQERRNLNISEQLCNARRDSRSPRT